MNYEVCYNSHNTTAPIQHEETNHLEYYHEYTPVQVENNSESFVIAPSSATVLTDLSNSSVKPLHQPWATNEQFNNMEQNHQQIVYLSHIPQYQTNSSEHVNFYFIEPQDTIGNDVSNDENPKLEEHIRNDNSKQQQSTGELDELRRWRKRPKSSENKNWYEVFNQLQKQRGIANERERQRTHSLNEAFASLRQNIPTMSSEKLTKIQIVQLAKRYIEFLCHILTNGETSQSSASSAENEKFTQEKLNFAFSVWRMGNHNGKTKNDTK